MREIRMFWWVPFVVMLGAAPGVFLKVGTPPALAQSPPICVPQRQQVNLAGQGADIVVGPTPVQTLLASTARCQVMLRNNGAQPMRCLPTAQGLPSATTGLLFAANDQLVMTTAGRESWTCIRTTGSSTTATTIEEVP